MTLAQPGARHRRERRALPARPLHGERSRRSPPGRAVTSRPSDRFARWAVDAVALLLPRLDGVTRTEWLLYGAPAAGAFAAGPRRPRRLRRAPHRRGAVRLPSAQRMSAERGRSRRCRSGSALVLAAHARGCRSPARLAGPGAAGSADLPPAPRAEALRLASFGGRAGGLAARDALPAGLRLPRRQPHSSRSSTTAG